MRAGDKPFITLIEANTEASRESHLHVSRKNANRPALTSRRDKPFITVRGEKMANNSPEVGPLDLQSLIYDPRKRRRLNIQVSWLRDTTLSLFESREMPLFGDIQPNAYFPLALRTSSKLPR
jgi:hypothetical protein